jgi:hypothetical protein
MIKLTLQMPKEAAERLAKRFAENPDAARKDFGIESVSIRPTISPATITAIQMLGHNTAGRFDVWQLAGPRNGGRRARILSALTGTRQPQSKAGVTALRSAFYDVLGIIGDCEAERAENFRFVCTEITASPKT